MNLTDLRAELDRQAAIIDGTGDLPLEAVRRRASRIRHRRIAGTSAAFAAAVIVAASIIPGIDNGTPQPAQTPTFGIDGLPSQPPPSAPDDVVKDGFVIRHQIGEDKLRASVIGNAGATQLNLLAQTADKVVVRYLCSAKAGLYMRFEVLAGSHRLALSDGCIPKPERSFDDSSVAFTWPARAPGHNLTIRLVDTKTGKPVVDPSARLVLGVYDAGPYRSVGTLQVPEVVEHDGYRYRLDKLEHSPATENAGVLETTTPADVPFLIVYGTTGKDDVSLQPNGMGGEGGSGGFISGPSMSLQPIGARPAGRASVDTPGSPHSDGELVIGVYLPDR